VLKPKNGNYLELKTLDFNKCFIEYVVVVKKLTFIDKFCVFIESELFAIIGILTLS
jgi:hypothetical protein